MPVTHPILHKLGGPTGNRTPTRGLQSHCAPVITISPIIFVKHIERLLIRSTGRLTWIASAATVYASRQYALQRWHTTYPIIHRMSGWGLAEASGFEPNLTESKSVVLTGLHYAPIKSTESFFAFFQEKFLICWIDSKNTTGYLYVNEYESFAIPLS